jgi:hypothetical protein
MFATLKDGTPPEYDFCTIKFSGTDYLPRRIDYCEEIQTSLERKLGKSAKAKS